MTFALSFAPYNKYQIHNFTPTAICKMISQKNNYNYNAFKQ